MRARWRNTPWADARVVDTQIVRNKKKVYIHYDGWSHSWDEWITDPARIKWRGDAVDTALEEDATRRSTATRKVTKWSTESCTTRWRSSPRCAASKR